MSLPNFLIIGTTKGGTTSLYRYFSSHPEIYMSPVKEPRYFAFDKTDPDHLGRGVHSYPVTSMEQYLTLFDGVKREKAVGEASPIYLNSPIAAARIKSSIPDVKLVASLRNPVDRAYSHYLMYCREGESRTPFIDAFKGNGKNEESYTHFIRTSFYYQKLKRYFSMFDHNQIKVAFLENLKEDPLKVIRELFRYLEVDENFVPEISKIHNPGGIQTNKILYSIARYGFLSPGQYRRLSEVIKPVVPQFIVNFRQQLMQRNLDKPPPLTPEIRKQLIDFYREDILKTQDLIKMDLGGWLNNG